MKNNPPNTMAAAMKRETRKVLFLISTFVLLLIISIWAYVYLLNPPQPHRMSSEDLGQMVDAFSASLGPVSPSEMRNEVDGYSESRSSGSVQQLSSDSAQYSAALQANN